MSVDMLSEYLSNKPEDIIKILELTDFHSISFSDAKNEIRCAYYEGGNPTSVWINCDTLQTYVFSKGVGGNLINLIAIHNNWNIFTATNNIMKILNLKNLDDISSPYIFNGIYKRHQCKKKKDNKIYSKEILDKYCNYPNIRFLQDNISLQTQFKFDIRYDTLNNRIIVPWYDKKGNLVGITGRYNFNDLGNNPKWKAIENFPKGNFLYGIYENQKEIEKSDYVIIGESEKFVMQLDSYGYHNALALGNCTITDTQARIIKSLPVNKIILALDEGVNIEHLLAQCNKLKGGIFNNSKEIYCIFDNNNEIIPKGSKGSPSDYGKENFEILLNKHCFRKEK